MDEELAYLIRQLEARQPRESTLHPDEQALLTRWELEDEAVRRGMAGLGDTQGLDWRRNV